MSNVKIITDSVACIPPDLMEKYDITVVPAANVLINGKGYIDGQDLTADEAYEQIKKDPDSFVTSATPPEFLKTAYEEAGKRTDSMLFVSIASALSALNKTAGLAAEVYTGQNPGKSIKVMNSRGCAGLQGLVVLAAAKAAQAGKNLDEVAAYAEKVRNKTTGLMLLDTLKYVYRTGRMSKTASKIVSLFNIRPINSVADDGTIEMIDRTRKRSDGLEKLLRLVDSRSEDKSLYFMVSHAAAADVAAGFAESLKEKFNSLDMIISDYSPVMGYGSGPGAVFVAFHPEVPLD